MQLSEINIVPAQKALHALSTALQQPKNEFTRDASIQRFEYSFELCWKVLRRYLEINAGIKEYNLKNIFREAAKLELIDNVENWFAYHEARNLTSHTYNENTAEETYLAAKKFLPDAIKLINNLAESIG